VAQIFDHRTSRIAALCPALAQRALRQALCLEGLGASPPFRWTRASGEDFARQVQPTTDGREAQRWQAETREALLMYDTHPSVTIGGARDVRRAVDNALRGFTLPADDLLAVRGTIVAAREVVE